MFIKMNDKEIVNLSEVIAIRNLSENRSPNIRIAWLTGTTDNFYFDSDRECDEKFAEIEAMVCKRDL